VPSYVPVSLGQTCGTRYQLVRHAFFRLFPDDGYEDFRRCVFDPANAKANFDTLIFDWQITQIFAVSYYLENDFQGIFERKDLAVTGDSNNLCNTRHLTTHPHSIHPRGEVLTEAELDEGYAEARAKIEHLAQKFRRQLTDTEPRLYVFNQMPDPDNAERLRRALARAARHPFRILFAGSDPTHAEALAREPYFDVRILPSAVDKPPGRDWEGDDAQWQAILDSYELRMLPFQAR
jgi:hypothetical protein